MENIKQNILNAFRPIANFFHRANKKEGFRSIIAALISIIIGLVAGFIIMLCIQPQYSLNGLWTLVSTGLSDASLFGRALYRATPMIFSGVAIAFSFKLGLFNIGITGQVTIGAFCSLLAGLSGVNWFLCMLIGAIVGAIAGFIPGWLKAKFNVNEVLSGIMLNWVIYYMIGIFGNTAVPSSFKDKTTPSELMMMPASGQMPSLGIPQMEGVSVGLIIAIVFVIGIFAVLNFTTFGFELQMTGRNKSASKYAGVNQTKSIILSLTISGALAGICGYMLYADPFSPTKFMWSSDSNTLLTDGFNGISVSLIAQNSPIGCIFSSIFLTLIDASKNSLRTISDGFYNIHYTELIKSVIIYVAALSSFFNLMLINWNNNNELKDYFRRYKTKKELKKEAN